MTTEKTTIEKLSIIVEIYFENAAENKFVRMYKTDLASGKFSIEVGDINGDNSSTKEIVYPVQWDKYFNEFMNRDYEIIFEKYEEVLREKKEEPEELEEKNDELERINKVLEILYNEAEFTVNDEYQENLYEKITYLQELHEKANNKKKITKEEIKNIREIYNEYK